MRWAVLVTFHDDLPFNSHAAFELLFCTELLLTESSAK